MPGISFLGTKPKEESKIAQILKGVTGGVQAWQKGRETEKAGEREERRIGIAEKGQEIDLTTLEYNKKRDAANMITTAVKMMDADKAADFLNQPQVKSLFDDLGWPVPEGLQKERTPKETALQAVESGEPLPGMTMEETKKLAGTYIAPPSITEKDITTTPWEPADWIPWKESTREKLRRMKREKVMGSGAAPSKTTAGSDPLGVRK